ncbi:MAG: tRNA (guanosine(46)-N7)-methyltransferase TrmB [Candidatus Omnitrophica bacterium]|nr:tRNA (guanosine(46)-N7)-methyltransferase TrmB [Candidatus Omnitrophota bacterium]
MPLVFKDLFGNSNPVELEIGCGKGKFLLERALADPATNFIGIDRVVKWMRRRKDRVEREGTPNIRFLRAEARAFLTGAVPPESLSMIHLYFPDPWPKRRHRDRRVLTEDFLRLMQSRLMSRGKLEIATDHPDYYDSMKKTVAAAPGLWDNARETRNERIVGRTQKTNYELKFEAEGKPLFYMELVKL